MQCRPQVHLLALLSHRAPFGSIARRYLSQNHKRIRSISSILKTPLDSINSDVEVEGHVRTIRNQKHRSFLELGDGSTTETLQALLTPEQAIGLGTGAAVRISGLWQASPAKSQQSHELLARDVRILGGSDAEKYPLQKKYHSPQFLRTIPHLRLRLPFSALIARLRSECEFSLSTFFRSNAFVRVHPPIITGADAEGAGETLSIAPIKESDSSTAEFFRQANHLSVSSQLHLEAFVHEHPRVWTLSPTFRAEKSDTPRHLSEFYMLEAELRTEDLNEVMDHVETMIRNVVLGLRSGVLEEFLNLKYTDARPEDRQEAPQKLLLSRWEGLQRQYWPRVSYSDAMQMLQDAHEKQSVEFRYTPKWDEGLQLEHEKFLATEIGRGSPVFVIDYPRSLKPFYMLPQADDTVACFDLLFPEVAEVVGGSLREHRANHLEPIMRERGFIHLDNKGLTQDLSWYLELRKFGSVPHGGYGLGFDRLIAYLAGVDNVRDVVTWPRYYGSCVG